ncbi:MAG: hypothetical protein Q8941_22400 [Bacteroidota bacterium]|nr:hypothetical protein [Bacteroidota bacterium]
MIRCFIILAVILSSCRFDNSDKKIVQDTLQKSKEQQVQKNADINKNESDSDFMSFWNKFKEVVKKSDQREFKAMSLDSLNCEHRHVSNDEFYKSYFLKIFDDSLKSKFSDKNMIEFIDEEIDINYLPEFAKHQIKGKPIIKKVNVTKINKIPSLIVVLEFIKTNEGYKFYGYDTFG